MLLAATKLESIDAYKLWIPGGLVFPSSELEYVKLYRSDCLGAVAVYSPVLKMLDLQACYDLRTIDILLETKGFPTIEKDFPTINPKTASKFDVSIMNCSFPEMLIPTLEENPRVSNIFGAGAADVEDDFGDGYLLSFV